MHKCERRRCLKAAYIELPNGVDKLQAGLQGDHALRGGCCFHPHIHGPHRSLPHAAAMHCIFNLKLHCLDFGDQTHVTRLAGWHKLCSLFRTSLSAQGEMHLRRSMRQHSMPQRCTAWHSTAWLGSGLCEDVAQIGDITDQTAAMPSGDYCTSESQRNTAKSESKGVSTCVRLPWWCRGLA